jgi:hypothetical protein
MRKTEPGNKSNGANECGDGSSQGSDDGAGQAPRRPGSKRVPEPLAQRVRKIALDALSPRARATTHLYMDPWSVPKGAVLGPSFQLWEAERDSILTFADFEPEANFAHPCSYFLHDAGSGELLRRVPAQFPPYPLEGIHLLDLFYEPRRPVETPPRKPRRRREMAARMDVALRAADAPVGRRYAILFSGVSDPRHLNDLELRYRQLVDDLGFAESDVFVLFHDGTGRGAPFLDKQRQKRPWPGATSAPDNEFRLATKVSGKGSRRAFNTVLTQLKATLVPGDLLYIHTEGHGGVRYGTDAGQYLYAIADGAASPDRYMDFDMESDLRRIENYDSLLVLMNQCYSGGFMDSVLAGSQAQRTFFAAACAQDKLAYATADLKWNRFAVNWIEREKLNDADGKVEAREAYDYCDDDDVRGPDTPLDGRVPAPGAGNHSPADEIVLR